MALAEETKEQVQFERADFSVFGRAVHEQFNRLAQIGLFRMNVDKDALWRTYLSSFPEGSNPMFRERTEHDCQTCKQFVRAVGGVVTIMSDNTIVSIWDVEVGGAYQVVADAMAALVKSGGIANVFASTESTAGAESTRGLEGRTWHHFHAAFPRKYVIEKLRIGTELSEIRSTKDVFARSLSELTLDSIDTALDLIAQGSLPRGDEQKHVLAEFRRLKILYEDLPAEQQDAYCWANYACRPRNVVRIRNAAIGTLLVDLSEGMDLTAAVSRWDHVMAPTNYRRPTALVSKAQIAKAQQAVNELGLATALQRRYAVLSDINIANVLYADRDARRAMNVFETLSATVAEKPQSFDKVEEVSIKTFLDEILPRATSVEVLFENHHLPNLVSLIAPVDPEAKLMFKWPNPFSWSYVGNLADSMREKVKRAGGRVDGVLCCRLAWNCDDDLDFHMQEPAGGTHISYLNKRTRSICGGVLDVDANGGDGIRPDPVENIVYEDTRRMKDGVYVLAVHNYFRRSDGAGFQVEVEFGGKVHQLSYAGAVRQSETVHVAEITYSKASGFTIKPLIPSSQASKTVWGAATQTFHKVNVITLSPNHWNGCSVGNLQYFFMIDGFVNEDGARGFFNEFLTPELAVHGKVMEMVGSKMKTEASDRQLSGLGFPSTQRNHILCRVKGSFARTVKINF